MGIRGKVRVCATGSEPSPVQSLERPCGELERWSLPARVTEGVGGGVGLISGFQNSSRKHSGQIPGGICSGKDPSHVIKFPIFAAVVSSALDRVEGKLGAGRCHLSRHQPRGVREMNVAARSHAPSQALASVLGVWFRASR